MLAFYLNTHTISVEWFIEMFPQEVTLEALARTLKDSGQWSSMRRWIMYSHPRQAQARAI